MYQRIGSVAFKKDLGNIIALSGYLGNPEEQYKCIHIAGTNGKGSVSSMLAAVLQSAGYKVGLYTSPHLVSFRERIRIDGTPVSEEWICAFVDAHRTFIESLKPSFFEVTVAMALQCFAEEEVDIAVVEVGMGGRLDSTNIVRPELSVITNIGFDHEQFLGDTLAKIAYEKAGIMKSGAPVVIGEYDEETEQVFKEVAREKGTYLLRSWRSFQIVIREKELSGMKIDILSAKGNLPRRVELDLPGKYQQENLVTALAAIARLQEQAWEISPEDIAEGLANVKELTGLRGRMEVLEEKPLIIADTGHNEMAVKEIMDQLLTLDKQQVHIVWGMVNDKSREKILSLLPADARYYFARPDVPRGLDTGILMEDASDIGLVGEEFGSVPDALHAAKKNASPNDLIFIGGSTFVVADALKDGFAN